MGIRPVKLTALGLALLTSLAGALEESTAYQKELPNILWITSEDNSAYLTGAYGNSFATTPNIDRLARDGFLYTHVYGTNAVCAPSRNTIITGVHSASNGHENMRSGYAKSDVVRTYPEYLRQAGYYVTNNSKTDYNTPSIDPAAIWDESSNRAHYRNRPEGRPFFAIFNLTTSHESSIHTPIPTEELRHDPDRVTLPPYHPDTPEMRHDWAQYYDKIEDMDAQVGELLRELEDEGLADNTIVFYYGDHGGVLARSKRFVYETGTQVPFVIRIPEKYAHLYPAEQPGDKVDRLVNFVDLAPTLLSIAGVPIPDYMQGDAFLGPQKTRDPDYTFMSRLRMDERYDMVRAVRDERYRYIRNYMPFRITMQHVDYLFNAPSAQSWEDAFNAGTTNEVQSRFFHTKPVEELYDTESDYWEVTNLADDPAYADVLERMRNALTDWQREVRDVGLIPETEYPELAGDRSMYDYMRSPECPFDELLDAAALATSADPEALDTFIEYLNDDHAAVRYWGATGILILEDAARPAIPALKQAANDESGAVAILAAEALYGLGETDDAVRAYVNVLRHTTSFTMTDRNFALNSIDAIDDESPEIVSVVQDLYEEKSPHVQGFARYNVYDLLMSEYLLKKWGELDSENQ